MARKCEDCKIREKYKYWNEFPATKHRFFKIMPHDFEHQLNIPSKFTECFKGDISAWCTLIGPSGNNWRVQVSDTEDDHGRLTFLAGWGSFVRDNGIRFRDFLTFHYVGHSSLKVIIFDATGCEREESHFAKNVNTSLTTCISTLHLEDTNENSNDVISIPQESVEEVTRNNSTEDKQKISSVEEDDNMSEDYEEETDDESLGSANVIRPMKRPYGSGSGRGKSARAKISQMYYISNRRIIKEKEKQRALLMASKHKSRTGVPMVQITMKPTHVYRGLCITIPKRWAVEHMLNEAHKVELRVPLSGRSLTVGCRWVTSDQCQFRANWPTFVLENNLEEHDVCVFELIEKGKSGGKRTPIFDVHIYRVVDKHVALTVSRRMV